MVGSLRAHMEHTIELQQTTNCHIFHYEKWNHNWAHLWERFGSIFNVVVPPEVAAAAEERFGVAENRKQSRALVSFDKWDPKTLIHGNHIAEVETQWQEILLPEAQRELKQAFGATLLANYGYPVEIPDTVDSTGPALRSFKRSRSAHLILTSLHC